MKNGFRLTALALCAVLALGTFASAQLDTNGPNAILDINGSSPDGTVAGAAIDVPVPGNYVQTVTSGVNPQSGIIALGSIAPVTGVILGALPWGGSIDVGTGVAAGLPTGVFAIGDGIGLSVNPALDVFFATDDGNATLGTPPTFIYALSAGTALDGSILSTQYIVQDPTNPPFNLDNTGAATAQFKIGQQIIALTGDDGSVNIPFVVGNTFNFYGVNYPDVWINGNGYVNFSAITSVGAAGFTNDNLSWLNAEPSIALVMCDWNPGGTGPLDGVLHDEIGSTLRINYGDQQTAGGVSHFADADINNFETVLELDNGANPNEGTVTVSLNTLDQAAVTDFGNGLTGITPGGGAIAGGDGDKNMNEVNFGLANEAIFEEHNGLGDNASTIGWMASNGQNRGYNSFTRKMNGMSMQFLPNSPAAAITGDQGYTMFPLVTSSVPDFDVASVSVNGTGTNVASTLGGDTADMAGHFYGTSSTGLTVTVDPAGLLGGPFAATYAGTLDDGANPFSLPNAQPAVNRNGEAIQVILPAVTSAGLHDVEITDGVNTSTVQINFQAPGIIPTSYTLADDGNVAHPLVATMSLYGVVRPQIFIGSNGQITMNNGSNDFTETMPEFFDGMGGGTMNPGVALCYSDLNRGGTTSGATYDVLEDTVLGTVQVTYTNQNHWSSQEPAGTFSATFGALGPDSVALDYTGFIAATTNTDDIIIGVSDGDALSAGDQTDLSDGLGTGIFNQLGIYATVNAPDSVGEVVPANTPMPFVAPISFLDVAANGTFSIF